MKHKKQRTIGDIEKEMRIRDKKLAQEQALLIVDPDLEVSKGRLEQIQERGYNYCRTCRKKKYLKKFYTTYKKAKNKPKILTKIWPDCRKCMCRARKDRRTQSTQYIIQACFEHYHNKKTKVKCSKCSHSVFESLVLFDKSYPDKNAIILPSKYKWLYTHKFPHLGVIILCYNCAYFSIKTQSKKLKGKRHEK